MTLSKTIQAELRKYKPGTILKSCDITGVVVPNCYPECEDKVTVDWETGQCYDYEREWLDCNTTVEGIEEGTDD